jgi:hypothetical protein
MSRVKEFEATGLAPNGRLYAGDLLAIQDHYADLSNFAQVVGLGTLQVGDTSLMVVKYGSGEIRMTGAVRTDGILRGLGGLYAGSFTTAQRDAIPTGQRPYGLIILNTTTNSFEWNSGTDATPVWTSFSGELGGDLSGSLPNPVVIRASGAFALPGDITPGQLTADVNDYAPTGLATASVIRLNASAKWTITGLTGGTDGRLIITENIGNFPITLAHDSGSSAAANRFSLPGASSALLAPGEMNVMLYDATMQRWRIAARSAPTTFIGAAVYPTAGQTLVSGGSAVLMAWGGEDYDTSGFHAPGASRLVIPPGLDGMYEIDFVVAVNGPTALTYYILLNGGSYLMAGAPPGQGSLSPPIPTVIGQIRCPFVYLNTGDYIEAWARSGPGGPTTTTTVRSAGQPGLASMFTLRKIG